MSFLILSLCMVDCCVISCFLFWVIASSCLFLDIVVYQLLSLLLLLLLAYIVVAFTITVNVAAEPFSCLFM